MGAAGGGAGRAVVGCQWHELLETGGTNFLKFSEELVAAVSVWHQLAPTRCPSLII